MLIAIKSMGGESTEAWRAVLDDLIQRGLKRPEFLIIDGASGLENAIAAVWHGVPVQRCTVHKHRTLLAHAPERLREEIHRRLQRHDLRGGAVAESAGLGQPESGVPVKPVALSPRQLIENRRGR
jgi:transposase-like protein